MTKQYIITEAQRNTILAVAKYDDIVRITNTLQSLPEITGEPVAYLRARTTSTHWNSFELAPRDMDNAFPVYTRTQPLQPITAEMVTDEVVREWHVKAFSAQAAHSASDKHMIAGAVNAYLKEKL